MAGGGEVVPGEGGGLDMRVASSGQGRQRRYDVRPARKATPPRARSPWAQAMADKLEGEVAKAKYRLRQQTVEPVFGIIKNVLGFTRFTLRGQAKVEGEWQLVCLAYNCKRLNRLMAG